jgi:hypothetical protein
LFRNIRREHNAHSRLPYLPRQFHPSYRPISHAIAAHDETIRLIPCRNAYAETIRTAFRNIVLPLSPRRINTIEPRMGGLQSETLHPRNSIRGTPFGPDSIK